MTNTEHPLVTESILTPHVRANAVGVRQKRTRDRIFSTIGKTVDLGMDVSGFALETTGFVAGKAIRITGETLRSATQGLMGHSYRHAA